MPELYPKESYPKGLPEGKFIQAGDVGVLIRNDTLYQQRFANFSKYFYGRIYGGKEYPLDYAQQAILVERPDDRIVFLALNSCWQIDHHFQERMGISIGALSKAIDRSQVGSQNEWLKIAVWHHPITGSNAMKSDFMQLLAVQGFQVCMHGHIHESTQDFYHYDSKRRINIVGAGTFGAPSNEQVTGIPLQYNLLTYNPGTGDINVSTRKKEKIEGAWSADARWGDMNNPTPWYRFNVKRDHEQSVPKKKRQEKHEFCKKR